MVRNLTQTPAFYLAESAKWAAEARMVLREYRHPYSPYRHCDYLAARGMAEVYLRSASQRRLEVS